MSAEQRAMPARSGGNGRLAILDGLRLLAATMVVFYHYVGVPNAKIGDQGRSKAVAWGASSAAVFPNVMHQMALYGWTGVELFFLISGFVICMSGWGRRPADFFVSRVVRLVPAYWAAIGLTAAVLIMFPRLSSGVRVSVVLTNLTMVQSVYGVPNLDPAYWTLLVELMFYLLFGIVAIGGITYRRMITFCVLWSVASLAVANAHNPTLKLIVDPPYSAYFVAGIAFFLIYKFGSNLLLWAIVGYSWLISVNVPRYSPPWQLTVVLTSFFVIMALVATHRLDGIRWRWLTMAGALTYPLYLIHQDIGFTVISYLRGRLPAIAVVAMTYALMLGLAWLIHRGVERPIAPLLKAKLTEAVASVRLSGPATPALAGFGALRAGRGATPSAPARPDQAPARPWPDDSGSAGNERDLLDRGSPGQAQPDQAQPDQAQPDQTRPEPAYPEPGRSGHVRPIWPGPPAPAGQQTGAGAARRVPTHVGNGGQVPVRFTSSES